VTGRRQIPLYLNVTQNLFGRTWLHVGTVSYCTLCGWWLVELPKPFRALKRAFEVKGKLMIRVTPVVSQIHVVVLRVLGRQTRIT